MDKVDKAEEIAMEKKSLLLMLYRHTTSVDYVITELSNALRSFRDEAVKMTIPYMTPKDYHQYLRALKTQSEGAKT